MKKIIIFIVIVAVLAWAAQTFSNFKVIDYAKNYAAKIDWTAIKTNFGFKPAIPPADKQLNIFIRDEKFLPNASAILLNSNVTWYNEDVKNHTVTGENWGSAELKPGQEFSKKFDSPGTYQYHCSIHPSEIGSIVVQ